MSFSASYGSIVEKAFPPLKDVKGIDKLVLKACLGTIKIADFLGNVFYGFPVEVNNYKTNKKKPQDPMRLGIIPIIRLFAKVNYCDLVNYAFSKIPKSGSKFDPDNPPKDDAPIAVQKLWKLQFQAYKAEKKIDKFYSVVSLLDTNRSKETFLETMNSIKIDLGSSFQDLLNEPIKIQTYEGSGVYVPGINPNPAAAQTLINSFPGLTRLNNYINGFFRYLDGYVDARAIPDEEFKKALKKLDKLKSIITIIKSLSSPLGIFGTAFLGFFGDYIKKDLQRLVDLFPPQKALPMLRKLVQTCVKIQTTCQNLLNFIQTAQLMISIVMIIITVVLKILAFFKIMPIPNLYTTVGVTNTMTGIQENVLKVRLIWRIMGTLGRILLLLQMIQLLILSIIGPINEIIRNLNIIIANLSNCSGVDQDVINELTNARNGLQKASDLMYLFVKNKEINDQEDGIFNPNIPPVDEAIKNNVYDDNGLGAFWDVNPTLETPEGNNYRNNVTDPTKKIGNYTIQIVTEEVTDSEIRLRRRYGVALDSNGIVIVQSMPTFASDSQVIIREVEQMLASKGLIKSVGSDEAINNEQRDTIESASNYLFNKDLNVPEFRDLFMRNRKVASGDVSAATAASEYSDELPDSFKATEVGFEDFTVDNDIFDDDNFVLDEFDLDGPDNENENEGLGLNAFANKLSGGKKLRNRVRKLLAQRLSKLKNDTQNTGYKGNVTDKVTNTSSNVGGIAPTPTRAVTGPR